MDDRELLEHINSIAGSDHKQLEDIPVTTLLIIQCLLLEERVADNEFLGFDGALHRLARG